MHFLIIESETADERASRRASAGKSAAESYAATLVQLVPGAATSIVAPADDGDLPDAAALARFDAVFVTGSPLHVYDQSPLVQRHLGVMADIFASRTPAFGSCAGLQLAVAAAGGQVRKMPRRMEAGVARRITAPREGRDHPLLAGRAPVWDAPAIHGDEVVELPEGATWLATNGVTRVQAAEVRSCGGVFWGVQYHPELALGEIAAALRRDADGLVEAELADDRQDVMARADLFDRLHREPGRSSLRWLLGVDAEFADEERRRTEIVNFLAWLPKLRG